jgi:lipoprotein-anchoring transpeptidase ErfK/SrfK
MNAVTEIGLGKYEEACQRIGVSSTPLLILISVEEQKLYLIDKGTIIDSYSISTGEKGIGQEEGSFQTPLGLHSVAEKIGDGEDAFAVFKSRVPTGEIASSTTYQRAILGRILWLTGLEPGFNQGKNSQGKNVDSYHRYIYIHGTFDIDQIGTPASAGCVTLHPNDVIALYDKTPPGTHVYISA